jgi:hypothetical protein
LPDIEKHSTARYLRTYGGLLQQLGGPLTTKRFISQPIVGGGPAEMDIAQPS